MIKSTAFILFLGVYSLFSGVESQSLKPSSTPPGKSFEATDTSKIKLDSSLIQLKTIINKAKKTATELKCEYAKCAKKDDEVER